MERTIASLKYENVCRLCLSTRGETQPIFSSGSSSGETASPVLASKIEECVSVKINESDELPTQICRKCLGNVNNWHIFKKVCNDAQDKLRDWIKSEVTGQVNIKKEPFTDELADDELLIDASYPSIEASTLGGDNKIQPEGPPILASLGLAPRNEKSNVDPRADWDRVVAIQSLIEKDEPVEGNESAPEDDTLDVDVSQVDSDSDQSLSSHDEESAKNDYKSKDGYTKWHRKPCKYPNPDTLKRKHIPGCAGSAEGLQTPSQAWSCLISESIIDIIADSTNEYIEKNYPAVGITGDLNENLTGRSEIKALIGILYLSGIMRPAFHHSSELWWGDGCGLSVVQLAMTLDRFKFLLKCLRFDTLKSKMTAEDKLSPIRQILDEFNMNCKQSYNFGESAVIDEAIVPFEGKCSFRKSLQSKKYSKNGIHIYTLVEPDTFYTGNIEVCTEPKANSDLARMRTSLDTINRLVSHLSGTGITLVTRARMTSQNLAKHVREEHDLYLVGSLHSQRKEVPKIFHSKSNKIYNSLFGFSLKGSTLVSYTNPKKKACLLLSTRSDHFNMKKYSRGGVPEALVWYKQRRGAARVAATLAAAYTSSKRSSRWPLALFFYILDLATINAQVLWMSNRTQADIIFRRNFIRSLALELMNEHLKSNSNEDKSSFELDPLLAIRGGPMKNASSADAVLRRHRRCKLCPRKEDRKTRSYCVACNIPACKDHYKTLCVCCALKF